MDLLKPIIKHITYPAYMRRDGNHPAPFLKFLMASQYWSKDELENYQVEKLRALCRFAYKQNDFYRRRFDSVHFHPNDIKGLEDIQVLPILTKSDIRSAGDQLFSAGFHKRNTLHKRTGGSTSIPLHLYVDREASNMKVAATLRHDSWAGSEPGEKTAAVWGDTDKPLAVKERLRNALTSRAVYLDTLGLTEERLEHFTANVLRRRPSILIGHAHSIYLFSLYVSTRNLANISFKGIITTAMVLSPDERRTIESTFRSPVFNRYGCEELSIIASESTAHSGMHIFAEGVYIEPLGTGSNAPGEVIITDLLNRAMPLIRYQIGDRAVQALGDCSSGRGLPRLQQVNGRTADFLYKPDGTPVFGISLLDTFLIHVAGVRQMQIVQKQLNTLDMHIVRSSDYSDDTLKELDQIVQNVFGDGIALTVHFVESIAQTERGKYRFSICEIPGYSKDIGRSPSNDK